MHKLLYIIVVEKEINKGNKDMKNIVLSLVSLLMFVGCDVDDPTSYGGSFSGSVTLDGNPFRETLDCVEPNTIWYNILYPDASAYSYCCCMEGSTNYSEYIDFDYYSWNFNCDVSDSTYCFFE